MEHGIAKHSTKEFKDVLTVPNGAIQTEQVNGQTVTYVEKLDNQGNVTAFDYDAQSADYNHLGYNEANTVLIAQLMGLRPRTPAGGSADRPSDMYEIPNRRVATQVVGLPLIYETPLRTGNLRDPNGPQVTFASESFVDELAAAAKADPVAFRLISLCKQPVSHPGAPTGCGWPTRRWRPFRAPG